MIVSVLPLTSSAISPALVSAYSMCRYPGPGPRSRWAQEKRIPPSEALARSAEEASTVRVIVRLPRSVVSICGGSMLAGPSPSTGSAWGWPGTVELPTTPGRSRAPVKPVTGVPAGTQGWSVLVTGARVAAGSALKVVT